MIWTDLLKLILDAQSALTSIQNHPATQNATDAITNGQVCDPGPLSHWWRILIMTSTSFVCNPLYTHCSPHQGPVAETVKDQHAKTTSEFRNLANSRATPSQPAATGQPLTRMESTIFDIHYAHWLEIQDYHSFFYNLLSVCCYSD